MYLTTSYINQQINVESSYCRELIYNIEHCIHHQAFIKTALFSIGKTEIEENFGVAKSTIQYRKKINSLYTDNSIF